MTRLFLVRSPLKGRANELRETYVRVYGTSDGTSTFGSRLIGTKTGGWGCSSLGATYFSCRLASMTEAVMEAAYGPDSKMTIWAGRLPYRPALFVADWDPSFEPCSLALHISGIA